VSSVRPDMLGTQLPVDAALPAYSSAQEHSPEIIFFKLDGIPIISIIFDLNQT
jgi:hypothetical protein